jgi:hypothetical protein
MLEYFKIILQKVSFDQKLFEKELKKAVDSLILKEIKELKAWCYQTFGHVYKRIMDRIFKRFQRRFA